MRRGMSMWFAAFISVFYACGFALLGYGVWSLRRSVEAEQWPVVRGTIQSCSMKRDSNSDGGPTYEVQVVYAYTVGGVDYTNDRLAFGYSSSSGYDAHHEILAKLEKAQAVDVRYDPLNPQSSVLSYGVHRSIQFVLAFAVTWLAFVIGFTLLWWIAAQGDSVLMENLTTH